MRSIRHMTQEILKYFKTPQAAAEFVLIHTEGEIRQKLLGVTLKHYQDKKLAESWFKQPCFDVLSFEAEQELEGMYNEMTR